MFFLIFQNPYQEISKKRLTPPLPNPCSSSLLQTHTMQKTAKAVRLMMRCPTCNRRLRPQSYDRHMNGHLLKQLAQRSNPRRRHQCTECLAAFLTNDTLRQHAAQHRTFRPFGCDACDQSFTTVSNTRRHRWLVHGLVNMVAPQTFREVAQRNQELVYKNPTVTVATAVQPILATVATTVGDEQQPQQQEEQQPQQQQQLLLEDVIQSWMPVDGPTTPCVAESCAEYIEIL